MTRVILLRKRIFYLYLFFFLRNQCFQKEIQQHCLVTHAVWWFVLNWLWATQHGKVRKEVLGSSVRQVNSYRSHHTCLFTAVVQTFLWGKTAQCQERTDPTSFGLYLVSCTSTADAQGHSSSITHVRIVTLWQQWNNAGALFRGPDKKQRKWRQCYRWNILKQDGRILIIFFKLMGNNSYISHRSWRIKNWNYWY